MTKRGHSLLVIGLMLGVSGVNVGCGAEEGVTVEEYGRLPDRGGDGGGMGEGGPGGRGGSDDGRPEVAPLALEVIGRPGEKRGVGGEQVVLEL